MAWTMPDYLTALRDKLRLRAGLLGVQIMSAPINDDDVEMEGIVIVDVTANQDIEIIGQSPARRDQEEYEVNGVVWCFKDGKGEAEAVAARERAAELLAEVEDNVKTEFSAGLNSIGNQKILMAQLSAKDLRQGINDGKRRAIITFTILVKARV